jgi:hypothetical protein
MQAVQAAHVGAPATGLAAKAGRIGTAADRELIPIKDLVAVEIGNGDFRRGNQVEPFLLIDIHLPFLIRELTGGSGTFRIDHNRGQHLLIAVFLRLL